MHGYEKYARTDIETSDPRAVIVLLYEGCIRFLGEALTACQTNQRMEVSNNINRALKIVQFLSSALDFEKGGEVAENLSRLYVYIRDTLLQANVACDPDKIEESRNLLKTLLEAWREVAHDPQAAAALETRGSFAPSPTPTEITSSDSDQTQANEPTQDGEVESAVVHSSHPAPLSQPAGGRGASSPPLAPGAKAAARSAYGIRHAIG